VPLGWNQASPGRTRTLAGPGPAVRRGRVSRSSVCETVRQANGLRDVDWTFGKFILLYITVLPATPFYCSKRLFFLKGGKVGFDRLIDLKALLLTEAADDAAVELLLAFGR